MKQKYNNTLVIFDEIVEALKSIVECSMVRDENEYFNNKYESETNNIISEDEEILYNALKELKKTIDASGRLFRTLIEDELSKISCDKFKLSCNYLLGYEKRKLTAEKKSIELLKNASIGIESLYEVSEDEKIREKERIEETKKLDSNKVFSSFESQIIADFPNFFLTDEEEKNNELDEMKEMNGITKDEYYFPEELNSNTDEYNISNILLLEKAIKKAKMLGRDDLVVELTKKLDAEYK